MLFDASVFIGALFTGDSRHAEARPLVEAARCGAMLACTTTGILSEVYAALTWQAAGVKLVYTYDVEDWESFEVDGLSIGGPSTTLVRLGRS